MSDFVVEVHGLTKRYGSKVALDGLDLLVPKGSVFGLLGPNGAGKTTTFGILCGWLRASGGRASVLGMPCNRLYRLRGQVAALPQDALFPANTSVREELSHLGRLMGLSASEAQRAADLALERVGLQHTAKMRGDELSHGMAKRVGMAQALIGQPKVIFLDEPTSGLDPRSAHTVKEIISSLAPETTVVLSSHNLVDVQALCSHGAILDHGRLVASGTMAALTRRSAEVTIEVDGTALPQAELARRFGVDRVLVSHEGDRHFVRIVCPEGSQVTRVIAEALRVLLDAETPILGVSRGTSLEAAFLQMTHDERG